MGGERKFDAFHAALNLALGGVGPAAVPRLIEELNAGANEGNRRAAAAVSLCRIGDPRAAEPLIERVTRKGWSISMPMSYIYALVRLGRIEDAKAAMARYRPRPSAERNCFDEIVEKFPDGGAPELICLIQGPHEKPDRRYSSSRCVALGRPRRPKWTDVAARPAYLPNTHSSVLIAKLSASVITIAK